MDNPRRVFHLYLRYVSVEAWRFASSEPAFCRGMRLAVPGGWFAGALLRKGRTGLTFVYSHDKTLDTLRRLAFWR